MGPRNLVILFVSTVAVSLVLLILFFSLFFKNVDLSFDTKMPESAPDLGNFYKDGKPSETRGDNVGGANVRVPQTALPNAINPPAKASSGVGDEDLNSLQGEELPLPAEDSTADDENLDNQDQLPSFNASSNSRNSQSPSSPMRGPITPPVPGNSGGSDPSQGKPTSVKPLVKQPLSKPFVKPNPQPEPKSQPQRSTRIEPEQRAMPTPSSSPSNPAPVGTDDTD